MADRPYRIHTIYDTETCNIGDGADTRAYTILYIFNDVSRVELAAYRPGHQDERIRLLRTYDDAMAYIEGVIDDGLSGGYIPIVCAYNLTFDLHPIIYGLSAEYHMEVCAQSAANIYYLSLYSEGAEVLRFWDTFHLEMGGLAAMGATCGFAKATGDWDYNLVRTPETPLTDAEIGYAKRDVQVIPAYLRYILESNPNIAPGDLGCSVITKTSLVRSMAKSDIGPLRIKTARRGDMSLLRAFELTCKQEMAPDYDVYCLRKACFRGGLTFTAANWADRPYSNSSSLDAVSMHHLFINGRYIPVHFRRMPPRCIEAMAETVLGTNLDDVLARYHKPFPCAFHGRFRFRNLRLKEGSVFEREGIACIPEGKFKASIGGSDIGEDPRAQAAEEGARASGWVDRAYEPVFAFSKLMQAAEAVLHLSEVELYTVGLMYDWDSIEAVLGEGTLKFTKPPDYVTLQSNILYRHKSAMKDALGAYREGEPYPGEIPADVPGHIAEAMADGSASAAFLAGYYNSTVKGKYNGIYGTQAQDVMKPDYLVEGGIISIDQETRLTRDNYGDRLPKRCRVLYTYGLRIVGGSRMHLAIAMLLLDRALGTRVDISGGDTDSMKLRCNGDVTDDELMAALEPLARAAARAIDTAQERVRRDFPDMAATFDGVGSFEVEKCGGNGRWEHHMEAWNKARVSESGGAYHITCAGLSRPAGAYTVEDAMAAIGSRIGFSRCARAVLGYNCEVGPELSHSLQKHVPLPSERYTGDVTDYLGHTSHVDSPQAIALYPAGRLLGDTSKRSNIENVRYLDGMGRRPNTSIRRLAIIDGEAAIEEVADIGIL